MELTKEMRGRVIVVTARGRLDGNTSPAFGARREELAAVSEPRLVVDFAGVNFVSSAGVRAVLMVLEQVKAANGRLALCAVQAPVREILDIAGITGMLDLHPAKAEAVAARA